MSCGIGASKPTYIVTFAENFNCIVCFIVAFVCLLHELCALQLGVACGDGLSETPKNSIAPITMGPDGFTMVFSPPTSAYVLLVPNHWSNDGMVMIHRWGLNYFESFKKCFNPSNSYPVSTINEWGVVSDFGSPRWAGRAGRMPGVRWRKMRPRAPPNGLCWASTGIHTCPLYANSTWPASSLH